MLYLRIEILKCLIYQMAKLNTISEASSLAIHSMLYILNSNNKLNSIQIAENTGASKHQISKILQRLVKDGLLKSNRGPLGGFELNKDANQITFYDIYKSIEGEISIEKYLSKKEKPIKKCSLCGFENKIITELKDYLSSTTLIKYSKKKQIKYNII